MVSTRAAAAAAAAAAGSRHDNDVNNMDGGRSKVSRWQAKRQRCLQCLIFIIICLMSLTGSLPLNTMWVEMKMLTEFVPNDAVAPTTILLVVYEACHVTPIIYFSVFHLRQRPDGHLPPTVPLIYSLFVPAVVGCVALALTWHRDTTPLVGIGQSVDSVIILVAALCVSLVAVTRPLIQFIFSVELRQCFFIAFIVGELLSGLIPNVMFVGQGLACNVTGCRNETETFVVNVAGAAVSVTRPSINFSSTTLFLVTSSIVVVGALSFLALRCLPALDGESSAYPPAPIFPPPLPPPPHASDALELTVVSSDCNSNSNNRGHYSDDDRRSSMPLPPPPQYWDNEEEAELEAMGEIPVASSSWSAATAAGLRRLQQRRAARLKRAQEKEKAKAEAQLRPRMLPFFLLVACWSNYVVEGPLSSVKACTFYPRGSFLILIGVFGSYVLALIGCLLASKTTPSSRLHLTIAMTTLASTLFAYFIALIGFSPTGSFNETGHWLTAISWPVVVGLLTYSRVIIGLICREQGLALTIVFAVVSQLGAALGALHVLGDLTVSRVFRHVIVVT